MTKKIIIVFILVLTLTVGIYFYYSSNSRQEENIGCIMDAKICPDGSAVGRSGANCEFEACPESSKKNKDNPVKYKASLPQGYTLEDFSVEKDLKVTCKHDNDCELPAEYAIQSRCPFVAICLKSSCNVVCPGRISNE